VAAHETILYTEDVGSYTFRDTALQARIERIATEQRQKLRLACIPLVFRVLITQRLKPRNATNRLARAGFDVIDIVVVYDA
jgi:N-dimethylarginine dimethylaminohydrolase